eukprot:1495871-Rhodomonas_salina.1
MLAHTHGMSRYACQSLPASANSQAPPGSDLLQVYLLPKSYAASGTDLATARAKEGISGQTALSASSAAQASGA